MPAVYDEEAWGVPAEREHVAEAVTTTTVLVEPSISDTRVQALIAFLSEEGYSAAEMAYAARELPKDEHLDAKMRYGKPLTPSDFERVIKRSRKVRAKWRQSMGYDTMVEMIEMTPELSREDFGHRHDSDNRTVYMLKADARKRLEGGQS